jgi:hypothetical protein
VTLPVRFSPSGLGFYVVFNGWNSCAECAIALGPTGVGCIASAAEAGASEGLLHYYVPSPG